MTRPDGQGNASPYLPLSIAVAVVSVGSILIRLAQAPALAVAFHRVFFATLALAPFALPKALRSWPSLTAAQGLLVLASGISLGVHFATWIASLSYTSVASSVLLVNMAPLFTLIFSRVFLAEIAPPAVKAAMALALGGASLIALGDWGGNTDSLLGDGLALAGAVTLSVYHVVGRSLRECVPLGAYVLAVWATAALTLAGFAWAFHVALLGYSTRTFALLLLLALGPTLAGHGLVNASLRVLPAPTVGLFLLGEPVGATLLAFLVFGEHPGLWTVSGGVLVLLALAFVVVKAKA